MFNLQCVPKPGIPIDQTGGITAKWREWSYALFEFTGAVPRRKWYSRGSETNDQATLKELSSPAFGPAANRPVSNVPPPQNMPRCRTVEYSSYQPKEIRLGPTAAASPSCC